MQAKKTNFNYVPNTAAVFGDSNQILNKGTDIASFCVNGHSEILRKEAADFKNFYLVLLILRISMAIIFKCSVNNDTIILFCSIVLF